LGTKTFILKTKYSFMFATNNTSDIEMKLY